MIEIDKDFQLLTKAKDLTNHTMKITDNPRRFPKKYRFTFVNRMQNISLDIYELINTANELNTNDEEALKERLKLQNLAITKCKTLLFLITLYLENENIGIDDRQAEYWARYVLNVKNMAVSWHMKDKQRK